MVSILRNSDDPSFAGCDFIVQLGEDRRGTKIKLLQITDMQFIDSTQRRTPDRLRDDEVRAWLPENFDAQGGNQIRGLVAQAQPDLIFITGDIIYGSFDDNGSVLTWFCNFMDSLQIPWAPVFGNHDNESAMGVSWQCAQFTASKYCLFQRGSVSGNCNYSVGIATGSELIRVLHMMDSNGCRAATDPAVIKEKCICPDQLALLRRHAAEVEKAQGKPIPAFAAFHIPTKEFLLAEESKGYRTPDREFYTIGVDVPALDGDFGCKYEAPIGIQTDDAFLQSMKDCNVEAVFAGHNHCNNSCISYEGIRWVYGLKTAQYDYHNAYQIGGTLITLEDRTFEICHIPALVHYAPFPQDMRVFSNFFA